ncbi:histidine kinase [Streptomyces brasiliscabiei]|uniref:histidine kinase n=1 Tax=Streptomyces brasiliscabiei TaxID=2736302 RepID=A0ABU8GD92_9ACTN
MTTSSLAALSARATQPHHHARPRSPVRRLSHQALYPALGVLWLLDMGIIVSQQRGPLDWLPLVTGPVALALVLVPDARLSITWRTGVCAGLSSAVTLGTSLMGWAMPEWGLLETACMLVLLARTCRNVARPRVALALAAAMGASVIDEPLRTGGTGITLTYPFLLTFAVGGAVGAGCYLRTLDARRRRTIAAVRLAERIQLARELHDFVAHHVTGIIAQAHAAGVIHESAPQQVGPILTNIAEAGQRTMDSMRRLIRVLREDEGEQTSIERPEEPYSELTKLVSAFSGQGDGSTAQLEITGAARRSVLLPEVGSAVHRVVQEALTNVRRHAPGSQATVRVHRTRDDLLRVDVYNEGPERRVSRPTGGRGGYGLVGLRERAEAVGGSLTSGPADDGGWWLIAHFPVRTEAALESAEESAAPASPTRRPPGRHAKPPGPTEPEPDMSWDAG